MTRERKDLNSLKQPPAVLQKVQEHRVTLSLAAQLLRAVNVADNKEEFSQQHHCPQ